MSAVADVDFHEVKPQHMQIHERLEHWARWANGRPKQNASPVFRGYRDRSYQNELPAPVVVRPLDAMLVGKGVGLLPSAHRDALLWCYLKPVHPRSKASELGTTLQGLAQLLHDGRQMLVNRCV